MGLIADEQSAMTHVLKTTGKARTWVAPRVGQEKTGPLNRILRGRFRPDRREKWGNPPVWKPTGRFCPGGLRRGV